MAYGYSKRVPALLFAIGLLVAGGFVASRLLGGSSDGARVCPRPFPQTDMTAMLLWTNAGYSMGPAPEIMDLHPDTLRPLTEPQDAAACARLRALLPDTLKPGLLAPNLVAFYRAGDRYIVPVIPNHTPSEIKAMSEGDFSAERSGTTSVYDGNFELLATYPN